MWTEITARCAAKMLAYHRLASAGGVYCRSLRVTLVVGTLLNLINQPEALLGLAPWNPAKWLLTYAVPFLVATYAAMAHRAASDLAPSGDSTPTSSNGEHHDHPH